MAGVSPALLLAKETTETMAIQVGWIAGVSPAS